MLLQVALTSCIPTLSRAHVLSDFSPALEHQKMADHLMGKEGDRQEAKGWQSNVGGSQSQHTISLKDRKASLLAIGSICRCAKQERLWSHGGVLLFAFWPSRCWRKHIFEPSTHWYLVSGKAMKSTWLGKQAQWLQLSSAGDNKHFTQRQNLLVWPAADQDDDGGLWNGATSLPHSDAAEDC